MHNQDYIDIYYNTTCSTMMHMIFDIIVICSIIILCQYNNMYIITNIQTSTDCNGCIRLYHLGCAVCTSFQPQSMYVLCVWLICCTIQYNCVDNHTLSVSISTHPLSVSFSTHSVYIVTLQYN